MTNEIAKIDMTDWAKVAALAGQDWGQQQGSDGKFPRLKINASHEDAASKPIKAGTFSVYNDDRTWYAATVSLRPFINSYQYLQWDPTGGASGKGTFSNQTILFRSFREELIDTNGGLACGKVKDLTGLSASALEAQKNIKCYRVVFGLVSGTFQDGTGPDAETLVITSLPVVFRMRGANFMPIDGVFKELSRSRKLLFHHSVDLKLNKEKQGSTIYYVMHPTLNAGAVLPFENTEMDLFTAFDGFINENNAVVLDQHKAAVAKASAKAKVGRIDPDRVTTLLTRDFADFDDTLNDSVEDLGR